MSSVIAILIEARRYPAQHTSPWYALASASHFFGYLVFAAGLMLVARTRNREVGLASLSYAIIVPIGVEEDRV